MMEQDVALHKLLHDLRVRLPDRHSAEQRQRSHEPAIAHDRGKDVLIAQAVAAAGLEVLNAVSGSRMHDPGAAVERHVFAEVDRRLAVVERMAETDVFQRPALARGERPPVSS